MFQYGIDSLHLDSPDRGWAAFVTLDVPRLRLVGRQERRAPVRAPGRAGREPPRQGNERAFSRDYQDARVAGPARSTPRSRRRATQVTLSEENLRLSRIRYDGGEGPALDVVAAQTQLAQARTNLYTALARYLESRADLELAAGR